MNQWFKNFIHNTIVHPIMPFLPTNIANYLHDKNAIWAFGLNTYDELYLENNE